MKYHVTLDSEKHIVMERTGDVRPLNRKEAYLDHNGRIRTWEPSEKSCGEYDILRHLTPEQLHAEQQPRLPPHLSAWLVKGVYLWQVFHQPDQSYIHMMPMGDTILKVLTAESFAAWVRENGAKCVYDPNASESSGKGD